MLDSCVKVQDRREELEGEDVVHHRFRFRRRKRHNPERTRGRQEISENIHGQEKFYGKPITLADREMVEERQGV